MNRKNRIWKYITALFVVIIILNPEMVEFALFIDAVGLVMFLMLLEIQLLTILGMFIRTKIKPIYAFVIYLYCRYSPALSWKNIKETPESMLLASPSPAIIMYLLVCSATIRIFLNSH